MGTKNTILTLLLILIQFSVSGQNIGAWEIDNKRVSPWIEEDIKSYEGIYHFGEGDGSNLLLIVNDTNITIQIIQSGYWLGGIAVEAGIIDTSELDIKWEFKNLSGIKITNGKLISDQYQGEFVIYTDSTGKRNGLKILNPWNEWIGKNRYEIGLITKKSFKEWYKGRFPQTSFKKLSNSELANISIDTLRIMRNEIFARYDNKFQKGSKMYLHFQKQQWYRPRYSIVNSFLTDIELANIELIKRIEEERKNGL